MSDVFISYKREEREIARTMATHLETCGWSVWWDHSLKGGDRFDEVIEQEITQASCVVVLWSPASVKSTFVRDEAYLALQLGTLLPVLIKPVELPFRFRTLHTINLTTWHDGTSPNSIGVLVRDIRSILESSESEAKGGQKPQDPTICKTREVEVTRKVSIEPQEVDILRLLSNGRSNSEIAVMLNISDQAVALYLGNVQQKLGASNKHQAVLFAIRARLI